MKPHSESGQRGVGNCSTKIPTTSQARPRRSTAAAGLQQGSPRTHRGRPRRTKKASLLTAGGTQTGGPPTWLPSRAARIGLGRKKTRLIRKRRYCTLTVLAFDRKKLAQDTLSAISEFSAGKKFVGHDGQLYAVGDKTRRGEYTATVKNGDDAPGDRGLSARDPFDDPSFAETQPDSSVPDRQALAFQPRRDRELVLVPRVGQRPQRGGLDRCSGKLLLFLRKRWPAAGHTFPPPPQEEANAKK